MRFRRDRSTTSRSTGRAVTGNAAVDRRGRRRWLGTSFVPEGAGEAYFAHLDDGLAAAGRTRADIDICQGAEVAFAADEDELIGMVADRKKELAFSLGGMGSSSTNYYNQAYSRQGWADVAAEVRERWQGGDRDGAAALVTDEMVLATTLIGTEKTVRARLAVWRDAGVDTVRLYPAGDTADAKLSDAGPGDRAGPRNLVTVPSARPMALRVAPRAAPAPRRQEPPERQVAARIAQCRQ